METGSVGGEHPCYCLCRDPPARSHAPLVPSAQPEGSRVKTKSEAVCHFQITPTPARPGHQVSGLSQRLTLDSCPPSSSSRAPAKRVLGNLEGHVVSSEPHETSTSTSLPGATSEVPLAGPRLVNLAAQHLPGPPGSTPQD
ncbi:hypothetical protein D623_10020571 [Myotis brandtii]|uniref:Uncharacterized protein n=1 Tax=Myotis brandtii TaxID=109478 RepID=S7NLJ0_MYOBR|nr:hypothetical protein D623_10020571 [Myotis brandtii]